MTVAELMKILGQFDGSSRVVVGGYEGGYDDVTAAKPILLRFDVNEQDYLGHHDDAGDDALSGGALLLVSNRRA